MIILLHVLIAVSSIAFASYNFFQPSFTKLYVSYGLIAATFVSGVVLIVGSQGHMLESCAMGLLYFGGVSVLTVKTRTRLVAQAIKSRRDIDA